MVVHTNPDEDHMDQVFSTQAEAEARVRELVAAGWEKLLCDDPEKARRGFAVFRYVSKSTGEPLVLPPEKHVPDPEGFSEECFMIQWEMFGKPLTPDVQDDVSVKELAETIRTETTPPLACDDPKALRMGFVWFHPDRSLAITRRVRLFHIKNNRPEDREDIQTIRELFERLRPKFEPIPVTA
jgi:hypothetical protein